MIAQEDLSLMRVAALRQAREELACGHAKECVCWTDEYELDPVVYWRQCLECGRVRRVPVSALRDYVLEELPYGTDDSICDDYRRRVRDQARRIFREYRRTRCIVFASYRDYLASSRWETRRARSLELVGHRCQVCNTEDDGLHVHHRTYDRVGNERDDDLIVLCKRCHRIFHTYGRLARPRQKKIIVCV